MKLVIFLLLAVAVAAGCVSQSQQGVSASVEPPVRPLVANASEPQLSNQNSFSSIKAEILGLQQGTSLLSSDHYDRLTASLDSFEAGGYPQDELASLRAIVESRKIKEGSSAQPPQPAHGAGTETTDQQEFGKLKSEITILQQQGAIIGAEHHDRLQAKLDTFVGKIAAAELANLREALKQLRPEAYGLPLPPQKPAPTPLWIEESESLPECTSQQLTVAPIDLNELLEVVPLGSLGPPGHTFPTEHLYLHVSYGRSSTRTVPLKAPADIYILSVSNSTDDIVPTRTEYSIGFALCKELRGYYNHVKGISKDLQAELDKTPCDKRYVVSESDCPKRLRYFVKASTVIGEVGHVQGNFDLGMLDYRVEHSFANRSRYTSRTPHIVCPLEQYDNATKSLLYSKVKRTAEPRCGEVALDIEGTLQGNWFAGSGTAEVPWEEHLAFVYDNGDPSKAVISIGGIFTAAGKWEFSPSAAGFVNRKFSDVTADGNIYCYTRGGSGRILVQLISVTQLKIEKQAGVCAGSWEFVKPVVYSR